MTIHLGTDHAGYALKEKIKAQLTKLGHTVVDHGAKSDKASDYPDYILPAAEAVAASSAKGGSASGGKGKVIGIVFGGSGIGECIAANKVKGVRAALVYDAYTAKLSREHNDANVLCLGSRTATKNLALAKKLVSLWLTTKFSNETRHVRRLAKISAYEK